MTHKLLDIALGNGYRTVVLVYLAAHLCYKLYKENREAAERDAYTDRVYRERSIAEKFAQMDRNRSEKSEDWGENGRWM
jgi:hypothetical protein